MREDIILAMEYNDLTNEQAKALLASPSPLADIFRDFEKIEGDHMDTIRHCVESRADKNIAMNSERNFVIFRCIFSLRLLQKSAANLKSFVLRTGRTSIARTPLKMRLPTITGTTTLTVHA